MNKIKNKIVSHKARLLMGMGCFMSLVTTAAVASVAAPKAQRPVEIQGHRGCRALRPENTLPAFAYAIEGGADVLEMDLAVTKDRHLVISHDPHINPVICLDPKGRKIDKDKAPFIHDLTLAEVKQYDCGSLQNPRFPKQQNVKTAIPTLDEVFELALKEEAGNRFDKKNSRPPIRFNIETKMFRDIERDDYPVTPSDFARLWYDNVKKYKMLDRSLFQSFDYRTLVAIKALDPRIKIAALSEDPQEDLVKTAKILGAEVISPYWEMPNVNEKTIAELHRRHVQMVPWTPDDPAAWAKLIKLGVDGIITDDPLALEAYMAQNSVPRLHAWKKSAK